jgi:acetyl-CoA acetyltransferase
MEKSVSVFIVDAARTPTVKYKPHDFRTMTELLAEPVKRLDSILLQNVDTVYATYRYPMPFQQRFDADQFIEQAGLPSAEVLRFRIDPLGMLGGLGVVDEIVRELSTGARRSTVLVVGGEVFEPSVADHLLKHSAGATSANDSDPDEFHRRTRRRLLSKYGGLALEDRKVGFTPATAHALVADAMFRAFHLSRKELSDLLREISCHLEKYAFVNPNSYQRNREGSPLERITSELYKATEARGDKWPFTLFDICGIVNSSAALVLTNDPPSFLRRKVHVAASVLNRRGGIGGILGREELSRVTSNAEAWQEIAARLGISFACPELTTQRARHVLELVDTFAYQVPLTLIDMGMFEDLRSILTGFQRGFFDPAPDTDKPQRIRDISPSCGVVLNPSGGSRDGTPHSAYGLVRAAECFRLLTGSGGERLLPPSQLDYAFVHAMSLANTTGILALKAC